MDIRETAAVLAMISALDGRKAFGEIDAQAWHAVIGDLRFGDCRDAVIAHYRDSPHTLMPADLRAGVKKVRKERIGEKVAPLPPVDPDDVDRYSHWQQVWYRAVGDGLTDHEAESFADAELGVIRHAIETRPRNFDLGTVAKRPS